MINQQRVRRIKSIIYAFIVLLFFLPAIVLTLLSFRMFGLVKNLTVYLEQSTSQVSPPSTSSDQTSGNVQAANQKVQEEDKVALSSQSSELSSSNSNDVQPASSGFMSEVSEAVENESMYVPNNYTPQSGNTNMYFDTLPVSSSFKNKTLYLTFDNTPSGNIEKILDLLESHNAKATFFVWWSDSVDSSDKLFKQIVDRGHSIGIHSNSNTDSFSQLYSSTDYFLNEYSIIFDRIYQQTNVKTRLYRLPGGSVNPQSPARQAVILKVKKELDSRGFVQFDWTASAQDAVVPSLSKEQILSNLRSSVGNSQNDVVLLHDGTGSDSTVAALDIFIGEYGAAGYSFSAIDYDTPPVSFLDYK